MAAHVPPPNRVLPVLTEVIVPVPDGPAVDPAQAALADRLTRELLPVLQAQVPAMVENLLRQQMRLFEHDLGQQLQASLRLAVQRALDDFACAPRTTEADNSPLTGLGTGNAPGSKSA